ncbi:MAG: hypothetical protein P9L92_15950 [Candidatus Electryonea clarkiae]|nr:hypothetical protein [Candidatus Electryonea clarkiae]MDP8285805.1 hypothetical protein [Candidatus Electryonea clarkiae]
MEFLKAKIEKRRFRWIFIVGFILLIIELVCIAFSIEAEDLILPTIIKETEILYYPAAIILVFLAFMEIHRRKIDRRENKLEIANLVVEFAWEINSFLHDQSTTKIATHHNKTEKKIIIWSIEGINTQLSLGSSISEILVSTEKNRNEEMFFLRETLSERIEAKHGKYCKKLFDLSFTVSDLTFAIIDAFVIEKDGILDVELSDEKTEIFENYAEFFNNKLKPKIENNSILKKFKIAIPIVTTDSAKDCIDFASSVSSKLNEKHPIPEFFGILRSKT